MAINPFIDSEIKRKAEAGIKLDSPDAEKTALYNQYQANLDRHIKTKAESGAAMDSGNAYKDQRYQFYQDNVKRHIQNKAATGQLLDSPNEWKQGVYNQYRDAQTPKYTAPTLPEVPNADSFTKGMADQLSSLVNDIYEKQKSAQLEQMRLNRDKAVGEINQQKSETAPMYADKRNQADVVNAQNVQRLREMMASAGLTSSGENVTAQVAQNNQRLNSLNSLNLEEQQTIDDFNRRISDLMNPANENALIAAVEAEKSRALYDAYNRAQDFGYQQYRDAIGDNRYTDETAYGRFMDSTDQRNYLDDRNYGRNRDSIADSQWQSQFDYQKERDAVGDNQWQQQFDYQKESDATEKAWREYTYNNMSAAEKANLDWMKEQYGEDQAWKMYELNYNGELAKSTAQAELNAYTSGAGSELDFLP